MNKPMSVTAGPGGLIARVFYSDGGRAAAGFEGTAGDCAVRAFAIAAKRPYREIYDLAARLNGRSARDGITRKVADRLAAHLGATWTPTMRVGQGCQVHLRRDELPSGRLVARVSKHFVAVIDGDVYDSHDPTRAGERCVYGYWSFQNNGGGR